MTTNNAPINVNPLAGDRGVEGGRLGIGGECEVKSLPVIGTFKHSMQSSFDQQ